MRVHQNQTSTPRIHARRSTAVMAVGMVLSFALLGLTPAAGAQEANPTCVTRTGSSHWKSAVATAKGALSKARTNLASAHYRKAKHQLKIMRRNTQIAHTAATALIGRPPTDPESDDPPGVTAVLKVGGLEHKITMALVPEFGDPHGRHGGRPLAHGVVQAVACRDAMLDKVIALKPGKRDDYVDGLSDTLPSYDKELSAISTALAGKGLTSGGRAALTDADTVVSATRSAMQKTFGGGERTPR